MSGTVRRWAPRSTVTGRISSVAFASGDQFVVGHWSRSPVGPISDVMWLDANDTRTLIASSDAAAEFITSIYSFDQVTVAALRVRSEASATNVATDQLSIDVAAGPLRPVPLWRPLWVTRRIEAPIARRLLGVETYGTSPTGAREWYQTRGWRWARGGSAQLDGRDLGPVVELERPMNVGFSNPPRRASIVSVKVTIEHG
jgi:hypothetical protein